MEVEFTLTASDQKEISLAGYRFLSFPYKVGQAVVITVGVLLVSAPVALTALSIPMGRTSSKMNPSMIALAVFIGLMLIVEGTGVARNRRLRPPSHRGDQAVAIDNDGFRINADGGLGQTVGWGRIAGFAESPHLFLLNSPRWPAVSSRMAFKYDRGFIYVIPKRAFNSGQIEEFRKLLKTHVPRDVA